MKDLRCHRRFFAFVLCGAMIAPAGSIAADGPELSAAIPAGYEVIGLKPSGQNLSLLGLIECPEIAGAQHVLQGRRSAVVTSRGEPITRFPGHFSFRITASLKKIVVDGPAATFHVAGDPRELLLQLRFRVRRYHGLERREVQPQSVDLIGVPAGVPSDERVYRIAVNMDEAPVTDRVVIEVLTPQGEVLTHFPFALL